jgi:TPR repeat protein
MKLNRSSTSTSSPEPIFRNSFEGFRNSFSEKISSLFRRSSSSGSESDQMEKLRLIRESFKGGLNSESKEEIYKKIDILRGVNWDKVIQLCNSYNSEEDLCLLVWKCEALFSKNKKTNALDQVFEIVKTDDPYEMYAIGKAYYILGNYEEAQKWFKQSSDEGNVYGQLNYAYMLEKGLGNLEMNLKSAFLLYEKAAETGYFKAQYNLGCFYDSGTGVEENKEKAFEYFLLSSAQGFAAAQSELGVYYKHKIVPSICKNVDIDEEAKRWWNASASQGYVRAKSLLSIYYDY